MSADILKEIETLPPLSKTVLRLKELYEDDEATARDIEKTISEDPFLVADILKIANSPYYGFAHEIFDLRHAIVLLGMDEIFNFALFSTVKTSLKPDFSPYGINEEIFLRVSLKKSAFRPFNAKAESSLFKSCAFLSDIGKVLIAKAAVKEGKKFDVSGSLTQIDEKEREFCGFDTLAVGAEIFKNWGFEDRIVQIIKLASECGNSPLSDALRSLRSNLDIRGELLKEYNGCMDKELFYASFPTSHV